MEEGFVQRVLPRSIAVGLACLALALIAIRPGWSAPRAPLAAWDVSVHQNHKPAKKHKRQPAPVADPAPVEAATQPVVSDELNALFDLSALDAHGTAWATSVLENSCDYDWTRLAQGLDGRKVKIEIATPSARGMFYPAEMRVEVHRYYYKNAPQQAGRILAWELAHAVDFLAMTSEQREQILGLYNYGPEDPQEWLTGPYEDQVGEAFMEGFVAAYCAPLSVRSDYFSHRTTPEIGQGIRQVLL
jgi:hypothetical protein